MPIYEYRRPDGTTFEVMQRMTDDPLTKDPETGVPLERVFHPVAVHFKGKGFYNTDYGTKRRNRELRESAESGADKYEAGQACSRRERRCRSHPAAGASATQSYRVAPNPVGTQVSSDEHEARGPSAAAMRFSGASWIRPVRIRTQASDDSACSESVSSRNSVNHRLDGGAHLRRRLQGRRPRPGCWPDERWPPSRWPPRSVPRDSDAWS